MLRVVHTGFFTTIQDEGRFNFRDKGVPVSGAMDSYSAKMANTLLNNDEGDALLEITMTGPTLAFEAPTYIAITGADMSASINGKPVPNYKVHPIHSGDVVSFGKLINGFRSYLAVRNGFKTEKVLSSRSYFKPITLLNRINEYMELPYEPVTEFEPKILDIRPAPFHKEQLLNVKPGPEYRLLEDQHLELLFSKEFSIAKENNRMAYQLVEMIPGHSKTLLTSATLPGTVQLTGAGKLIILMRDGQTTGGYPRILQMSERAVSMLSQKKNGDRVSFKL